MFIYFFFLIFLGTTALVAVTYKNELIVANVGDSRGVICDSKGNTIPLSFDHKPDQVSISLNKIWNCTSNLLLNYCTN